MGAPTTAADLRRPLRAAELRWLHRLFSMFVDAAAPASPGRAAAAASAGGAAGLADFVSLVAPLVALSGAASTLEDRAAAAALCFDPTETGWLSAEDVTSFLTLLLAVLYAAEPGLVQALQARGGPASSSPAPAERLLGQVAALVQIEDAGAAVAVGAAAAGLAQHALRACGEAVMVQHGQAGDAEAVEEVHVPDRAFAAWFAATFEDLEGEAERTRAVGEHVGAAAASASFTAAEAAPPRSRAARGLASSTAAQPRASLHVAGREEAADEGGEEEEEEKEAPAGFYGSRGDPADEDPRTAPWATCAEATRLLHLGGTTPHALLELVATAVGGGERGAETGLLSRDAWLAVCARLSLDAEAAALERTGSIAPAQHSPEERRRAAFFRAALFRAFSAGEDGADAGGAAVDAAEFVAGLVMLAGGGTRRDRIRTALVALDIGGGEGQGAEAGGSSGLSGRWATLPELVDYFACVFRAVHAVEPSALLGRRRRARAASEGEWAEGEDEEDAVAELAETAAAQYFAQLQEQQQQQQGASGRAARPGRVPVEAFLDLFVAAGASTAASAAAADKLPGPGGAAPLSGGEAAGGAVASSVYSSLPPAAAASWRGVMRSLGLDALGLTAVYAAFMAQALPRSEVLGGEDGEGEAEEEAGGELVLDSVRFARACRAVSEAAAGSPPTPEQSRAASGTATPTTAASGGSSARGGAPAHLLPAPEFARLVSRLFVALDCNADGVVNFPELIAGLMVLLPGAHSAERLAMAFTAFDSNGTCVLPCVRTLGGAPAGCGPQ